MIARLWSPDQERFWRCIGAQRAHEFIPEGVGKLLLVLLVVLRT